MEEDVSVSVSETPQRVARTPIEQKLQGWEQGTVCLMDRELTLTHKKSVLIFAGVLNKARKLDLNGK